MWQWYGQVILVASAGSGEFGALGTQDPYVEPSGDQVRVKYPNKQADADLVA